MNQRKLRYGPNSYLKSTEQEGNHKFSTMYPPSEAVLNQSQTSFAGGGYEAYKGTGKQSPLRDRGRSSSIEEAMRIEQRHLELKRQIALKEKQLADMTGDRDTVMQLRKRLGLKELNPDTAQLGKSASRRQTAQEESAKRGGYSSVSPDSSAPMVPSMTGMKSTTYGRPTSYEKSPSNLIQLQSSYAQKYNAGERHQTDNDQFHFYPTRLAKPRMTNPSHGSGSPLRSRSKSREEDSYSLNRREFGKTSITDIKKVSPYDQNRQRAAGSPLRTNKHPVIEEENVESSENQNEESIRYQSQLYVDSVNEGRSIINPQRVQPIKNQSGRPNMESHKLNSPFNQSVYGAAQDARSKLYKERIEAMTLDNQSLQRRLNQVNSELERIQRENEDLVRQYELADGDVQLYNKLINNKDDTDAQNNLLKQDLHSIQNVNQGLNGKLKEEEFRNAEIITKLEQCQNFRKSIEFEFDNMHGDFQQRISKFERLSREKSSVMQQLTNVNLQLDQLTRDDRILSHENSDLESNIYRLQNDRQDLLIKIQNLTERYDDAVRNMNFTKRHVDNDNSWQIKLITFKKLHVSLEIMIKSRKQNIFSEIKSYSAFDSKCHSKLRTLALRMERAGHFRLRTALNQWYDKSLKPYGTRLQNEDISIVIDCNKLQAKVFYALKQFHQQRNDHYHFKTNAINMIWHRLQTESRREKKRYFDIWKQKREFEKGALLKLRRIFKKKHLRRCEDVFQAWLSYCNLLEYHCRIKILHIDFTKKHFLSHAFHEFKNQIRAEKSNRIRSLNSIFKAWQDYIRYNRHLMQANMAAIRFRETNQEYTKRACFQALRLFTESKKYALLNHAVKNDVDVAVASLNEFNEKKNKREKLKASKRFATLTKDQFSKKIFSYFIHWKMNVEDYKQKMDTKVRDKVIRCYLALMRSYFVQWKKLSSDNETSKKIKIFQELQAQNLAMTNEALKEESNLRTKIEGDKTSKRKTVEKTARHLRDRRLAAAMNRWRDIVNTTKQQQGEAAFVIKKLRNRLLRQAFDKYLEFNAWHRQHKKNEERANHICDTIRLRELRKMYYAICWYTQWRKKIKKSWYHVLYKFDFFQKQRGVKRWKENAHFAYEGKLHQKQVGLTNKIHKDEEELQKHQVRIHGQNTVIKSKQTSLETKSYKEIGNYFIRIYNKQTYNHFQIWKGRVQFNNQKKAIIRRSIEHYNRKYLELIQSAFVKFMSDQRQREIMEEQKRVKIEQDDLNLAIQAENKRWAKELQRLKELLAQEGYEGSETQRKIEHTMEWMAKNNLTRVYRSKKRMIFEMWRTVVKEEIAFAHSVKNVIQKSMWKEGFARIKHQSRDIDFTQKVHRMLYRYSTKGQRIKMGDSFTKWKKFAFAKVDDKTEEVIEAINNNRQAFQDFRDKASETNQVRITNYFIEKNTQNIWRAWLKVIKHFKLVKAKTAEFKARQKKIRQKYAIRKWSMRMSYTIRFRTKCALQLSGQESLYLRACFNGWKKHHNNVKRLCYALSRLERLNRTQITSESFKNLKSFNTSKKLVVGKNHRTGAVKGSAILRNYYMRLLNQAFQRYKHQCTLFGGHNQKFNTNLKKYHSKRLRDAFYWWKDRHELAAMKEDLHLTGPVRAQEWKANKQIENLKQFMRDQHYTELEINKFFNDVCGQNDYLMKKYITRFKFLQDPKKKILPIVMDRWKGFVAIRKNVKHQFRFVANFKENQKAEMQIAFNKWRRGADKLEQELWRLDIKDLETLAWKTTEELKQCSDMIAENQAINNHLVLQRDEFLNYYIKGQVLAMALVKDRSEFAKMQGLSRWMRKFCKQVIDKMKTDLRDDEYYLANQEERKELLEQENETMEEENEEMRQFQQDGEIVKRNKLRLEEEVQVYKEHIDELDEELAKYQNEQIELLAKIQEQEDIIEENKKKGKINKFEEGHKKALLKQKTEGPEDSMANQAEETEEQRKQRLKMEQLDRLRKQGPALR